MAAALVVSAHATIHRTVERTFSVPPGGTLRISTDGGNVRVETAADGSTVSVVAHEQIRASSETAADDLLKRLDLVIEQKGPDVIATAAYDRNGFGFHFSAWPPVEVDFVVTVPRRFQADLKTSGGDVTVSDLDGTLQARTSGGNIEMGRIGGAVDAFTSGGNIRLKAGGDAVRLSTSGGNIDLGAAAGPADVRTSGGNLVVIGIAGSLQARTSGGDITAVFTRPLAADCSLSTSGGRVRATVPAGAHFYLNAETSGGDVRADGLNIAPDDGRSGSERLRGPVNGGGPGLRLRSSGGDVLIETQS